MLALLMFAQVLAADAEPLVVKARLARYQQDSTLASYRAIARQRISLGLGLSRVFGVGIPGPEKLAARFESVARMGWDHQTGAWGEIIGARGVAPIVGETKPDASFEVALVLPYNPGTDALWPMTELRGALSDHRDWITHPLDTGSDSLYEFSLGDSVAVRLPSGGRIRVREIQVRPRRPSGRLVVGSLWVDATTGNLVRAAYRPSTPVDLWPLIREEMHGDEEDAVKKFGPFVGNVREVVIEHGLYEGRFWLPTIRIASGEGTAHGVRASISISQAFSYERVSAMPAGQVTRMVTETDTAPDGRVRQPRWNGDFANGACRAANDSSPALSPDSLANSTGLRIVYAQGIRYRVLVPCDDSLMSHSPALPGSIYGDGEELFTDADLERLRNDVRFALSMDRQAKWNPLPPVVSFRWKRGQLRYNRIEGLSAGVHVETELGNGYVTEYQARIGLADLSPNAEATITRTNARSDLQLSAFRRLAAANEWGDPFALGPSAMALVFGRDDGLYYRTLGAELRGVRQPGEGGAAMTWKVFAQREDSARVETHRSLPNLVHGLRFTPNIGALPGLFAGASFIAIDSWGSDPDGSRLTGVLRLDGAGGESSFGRGSTELSLSRGFGSRTQATLTGSAGRALGELPPQRLWYIGGPYTVRGFAPGEMAGDAFWFGRLELTSGHLVARPSIFADAGWAGARADFARSGTPISGVGIGLTMIEGLARLDVARSSAGKYRADLYLNPR